MELDKQFIEQIRTLFPDECDAMLSAIASEPSVAIRVNAKKTTGIPKGCERVPWCDNGYYLQNRLAFTFDPLFHAGAYYVQDASSMFICHVLRHLLTSFDGTPISYLDLCAAPGGKTTTALDCLGDDSLMVCNEIDSQRAQILKENVIKWGRPNCVVTNDTPERLGRMKDFFDIVATDMPCSGEGMFRKDEEAVKQWSPALVEQCANRQKRIVDAVWTALKPGGYLIYSTCTFNRKENEELIDYIVTMYDAESVEIPVAAEWGIAGGVDTPFHCYRFLPHRVKGEGLFVAVVRKPGEMHGSRQKLTKDKSTHISNQCKQYLSGDYKWKLDGSNIFAMPLILSAKMELVAAKTKTMLCGVDVAQQKGKDIVPTHALSQSLGLCQNVCDVMDVNQSEAIAYLRGEPISCVPSVPRGFVLVRYCGVTLGWLKNIGGRTNNCYPKEWRIRSSFLPDVLPNIL